MTRWEHFTTLSARQRANMMAIATEFEISHGRDSLDENRRRSVQHGAEGNYWLGLEGGDNIVSFAVAETNLHGTSIEVVGGGYERALDLALAQLGTSNVQWWLRDGQTPDADFNVVRLLRYMEADDLRNSAESTDLTLRAFQPGVDE